MFIENNNIAHIGIEYVVIDIPENPYKRLRACSNISTKSCIRSEEVELTIARYSRI